MTNDTPQAEASTASQGTEPLVVEQAPPPTPPPLKMADDWSHNFGTRLLREGAVKSLTIVPGEFALAWRLRNKFHP